MPDSPVINGGGGSGSGRTPRRSSSTPDLAAVRAASASSAGGTGHHPSAAHPAGAERQLQQPSLGVGPAPAGSESDRQRTRTASPPTGAASSAGAAFPAALTPPRTARPVSLPVVGKATPPPPPSASHPPGAVHSTSFGTSHYQRSSVYDSDDDAVGAIAAVEESAGQFDLCSTLYKRRGGFGRNAEKNWVKRCFTLHGPILCYYDTPSISQSDPSRPRGRLHLQREETRAEMNTKYGTSSPTEFQVTLNLYVLGSKRKWELCCADQVEQKRWYEALKVYDGKPESVDDDVGGGEGSSGRRAVSSPTNAAATTPGRGGGYGTAGKSRSKEEQVAMRGRAATPTDDENSADVGADYGTFPPAAGSAAVARRSPRPRPRRSASAVRPSFLNHNVVVSFIALNVATYFARHGNEQTFYLAIFMVNLVFYYMLDHFNKREEVLRLQHASNFGRPPVRSRQMVRSGEYADIPTVIEEAPRSGTSPPLRPSIAKRMAAGSTFSRAAVKPNTPLSELIQKHGSTSAEALQAYASSTSDEYEEIHHGYWNVIASTFNLRIGPNYKKQGKKAPSAPALYDLYAVDIVQDEKIMKNVADNFEIPDIKGLTDIETGCMDVPPMFVITVNLPTEEPSMFGSETDGPSCIAVLYFVLSKNTLKELDDLDNASPGVKLLVEFCRKGGTDDAFRSRFKALAIVEEIDKLGLPSFITGYNGKPALITKSGSFARHSNYIEMTVNVHRWGFLPKKGLYMLKNEFPRFIVNIGFTVEGRKDHELPEVLLGGLRLMYFDLGKVGFVPGSGTDTDDIVLESGDSW